MESQEWVSLWRIQVQDYIAAATKRQAQRSIMPHDRQRQALCRTQGHLCGMGHSNTRCASPAQCDGLPAGTHTCLCTLELSQDPHRAEPVGKLVYWTERHFSILPAWPVFRAIADQSQDLGETGADVQHPQLQDWPRPHVPLSSQWFCLCCIS